MANEKFAEKKKEREDDDLSTIFVDDLTEEKKEEFLKILKEGDVKFEREKRMKEKRRKMDGELKKIEEMLE